MITVPQVIKGPFAALTRYGSLVRELSKREILGRYRGANFGMLWALISPFLMLAVYTLAFGSLLKSRWPRVNGEDHSFPLILFIGLIVHAFFSECIIQAPQLVSSNPSYVKKVVFPLEVLPWPMIFSSLFHMLMSLIAYAVLEIAFDHHLAWTIIIFPVVVLPLALLSLGVSWILASLGVYFRDISQITGVLTTALLFTSTAIVPLSAIPEGMRWLFEVNPLSFIIDQARNVAMWGVMPDWYGLGIYALAALLVAYVGYAMFMATRRGFADVL